MEGRTTGKFSVLLVIAGIVLALSGLSLPWYKFEFTGYTDLLEGGFYKGEYTCFREYYVFDDLGYLSGPGYNPWHGGIDDYRDLMTAETIIICLCVLLSIACIAALLYDRKGLAVALCGLAAGAAIIAAAYFVLAVDDALSIYLDGVFTPDIPDSFVGSGTDESGTDWSWGPSSGWVLIVASASVLSVVGMLQVVALREDQ